MFKKTATIVLILCLVFAFTCIAFGEEVNSDLYDFSDSPMMLTASSGNVSVWDGKDAGTFAGGMGTEAHPYRITKASQLAYLASFANNNSRDTDGKYFVLEADIDLNNIAWTPIGSSSNYFEGYFDGNGHVISNLKISSTASYRGLFGDCWDAEISNLNLKNVSVKGGESTGGLCGRFRSGNIYKCSVSGTVSGTQMIGGLCGQMDGTIFDSTNYAKVVGTGSYVGGISGWCNDIDHCVNFGIINSNGNNVGGIAGRNASYTVSNSYNYGAVGSVTCSYVGGISGQSKSIVNCGNGGSVTGKNYVGGICGEMVSGSISYVWTGGRVSCSGSYSGGIIGYAQSSSIVDTYRLSGSGPAYVCGSSPTGQYANTYGNNFTLTTMTTESFVKEFNSVIDTDIYYAWSWDGTSYGGFPYMELRTVTGISLGSMPSSTTFYEGSSFNPSGMVIYVTYDDGSESVLNAYTVSPSGELSKSDR